MLKVELFKNSKNLSFFTIFITIIFLFNLYLEYHKFIEVKHIGYTTVARVDKVIVHPNKIILKLWSDDNFMFYTKSKKIDNDLLNHYITVRLYTKRLTFLSFLKGTFIPSSILRIDYRDNLKIKLNKFIKNQHNDSGISSVYRAIFLAQPIDKDMRKKINRLGISHLIAISGFHITFLFTFFYAILFILYRVILRNYFLYRNKSKDLTLVIFMIIYFYLYLLNFTPATLRAYGMMLLSYFMFDRHIKILSFANLFLIFLIIIAFNIRMIFSLSFFLSISGVYFIFLFLKHFNKSHFITKFLLFNIFIWIMITPITLYFFHNLYITQLYSVLLTLLFFIFYPLSIALHSIGYGGLLDTFMSDLFTISSKKIIVNISISGLIIYIILILLSARFKYILYSILILNILFLSFYFIKGYLI